MSGKDRNIVEHILRYCEEINGTVRHFGERRETFLGDYIYRNACALCFVQIGELTAHLSDGFKAANPEIPWRSIKGFRNAVAHGYNSVSPEVFWNTVTDDIPALRLFCLKILS